MALVVEDGTGKVDAESFNSVVELDAYAAKWGLTFSGTTEQKEIAARQGARYMEAEYAGELTGSRAVLNQALSWPRLEAEDSDYDSYPADQFGIGGSYIPSNVVPQPWKDAHAEMSIRARAGEILPDVGGSDRLRSKDVSVGPIRKAVEYADSSSPVAWVRKVDLLVQRYLRSGSIVRRA